MKFNDDSSRGQQSVFGLVFVAQSGPVSDHRQLQQAISTPDPAVASSTARSVYFLASGTHIPLAVLVPGLAIWAAVLGYKDRRKSHLRVVRFAYPVWLYVSVTGVIVYAMLYQIYVPPS